MAKKSDDVLVLNTQAQQALQNMLSNMLELANMLKIVTGISKPRNQSDAILAKEIKSIEEQFTEMKLQAATSKEINPHVLNSLSEQLNNLQEKINKSEFKFSGTKVAETALKNNTLAKVFPTTPDHRNFAQQQQIDIYKNGIKSVVDNIRHDAVEIRSNSSPKHRSLWERFVRACVKFANTCKDKILSLFGKKKQEVAPEKPLGFREAHEAEVRKDPLKVQFREAAKTAAEVGRAKNPSQAQAAAEQPEQPEQVKNTRPPIPPRNRQ